MKTLLLIDANSLIHRCFHALPPLTAQDGTASQALYGVASILLKLWKQDRPDYAIAAFDRPEPTFRKKEYTEYKGTRPKAPDELISQLIEAHNLFAQFGIKTFEKPTIEADDIIATFATQFGDTQSDLRVVILTGDLDSLQLVVKDRVVVRTFRKGLSDTFTYDESAVIERFGLHPSQLIDYKSLVGDTSDNIRGVPGIGPKTATTILQKYHTLENFLDHIESEPKLKDKILPYKKQLLQAQWLVTLKRDVPFDFSSLSAFQTHEVTFSSLEDYFTRFGFVTLLQRLTSNAPQSKKNKKDSPSSKQYPASSVRTQQLFPSVKSIHSPFSSFSQKYVFIDHYQESLDVHNSEFLSKKYKVGFDVKHFLKYVHERGGEMLPPYYDLSVAFWLIDPDFAASSEQEFIMHFFKHRSRTTAIGLSEMFDFTYEKLHSMELFSIFEDIEMKLLPVLASMELRGIGVSLKKLENLEKKIESELAILSKKIQHLGGGDFNINSTQQLSNVLFEKLGIQPIKKKKESGYISTDADHLIQLKDAHPIIPLLLTYREYFKLLSTYVKPLQSVIDESGRIHTEYSQTGTGTGRLSSRNPNLQNIPQESVWSEPLRNAFESVQSSSFVAFDYSQLELRILAAITGDTVMKKAFFDGDDIHSKTASAILGIPFDVVTKEQRRLAKTLNFGLIYGMGVVAFSKTSGLPRKQAQEFIDRYFTHFSSIKAWQSRIKKEIHSRGYTQTISGRRRYFDGISSFSPQLVSAAERAGINFPIQGLGADILKLSMIAIEKDFIQRGWWGTSVHMLLTIHDELLFEVSDDMIETVIPVIRHLMENIFPHLGVPLVVDVSVGKQWGAMKKVSR